MKIAIIFVLTSMWFVCISAQAPGDVDTSCRTNRFNRAHYNWIPYVQDTSVGVRGQVKWQVLIDQYDYQNLLGEFVIPSGVWSAKDVDGTGRQVTITSLAGCHACLSK